MLDKLKEKIYKHAIWEWGADAQIRMTIEECGELIVKLAKLSRNHNYSTCDEVCEELADVEIMIEQMRYLFKAYNIDKIKDKKLMRLKSLLEESMKHAIH